MKKTAVTLNVSIPKCDRLYAAEKFSQAMYALAVGERGIKSRLFDALMEIHCVGERNLPPEMLQDYRWILAEVTKRAPNRRAFVHGKILVNFEGRFCATLNTMRIKKAVAIAERICELAQRLGTIKSADS